MSETAKRSDFEGEPIRMRIPNEELQAWEQTLRAGDMSEDEIQYVLAYLNKEYAVEHGTQNPDSYVQEAEEEYLLTYGIPMSGQAKQELYEEYAKYYKRMGGKDLYDPRTSFMGGSGNVGTLKR